MNCEGRKHLDLPIASADHDAGYKLILMTDGRGNKGTSHIPCSGQEGTRA